MSGPSNELARWFASLPEARQKSITAEFREGLREIGAAVRNDGAVQPVHPPFTGRHAHPHYAYGNGETGTHSHVHEHDDDADHGHDHPELDAAVRSAEAAKRSSQARRRPVLLNSVRSERVDDAWTRLAWSAQRIERDSR